MSVHTVRVQPGITFRRGSITAGASLVRIATLVVGFFLWEGVLPSVLGLPATYGRYLISLMVLLHLPLVAIKVASLREIPRFIVLLISIFSFFVFVSFLSSTFIFQYDSIEWISAQYISCLALLPLALYYWGFRVEEIGQAIFLTGLLSAFLILIIHSAKLYAVFWEYLRRSIYTSTYVRVVILKNEIAFAAIFAFFKLFFGNSNSKSYFWYSASLLFLVYTIAFSLDSRLALAAVMLGLVLGTLAFRTTFSRKAVIIVVGFAVSLFILPELYTKYIGGFRAGSYVEAANVKIRLQELEFFWRYYVDTYGIGFGYLSVSPDGENHAARAAWPTLKSQNGYGVQDLGIFASLVQFGPIGIALVVVLTVWCVRRFYRLGQAADHPGRLTAMTCFSMVLGFIISPWPMDFFTLAWSGFLGWTMVYLAIAAKPAMAGRANLDATGGARQQRSSAA